MPISIKDIISLYFKDNPRMKDLSSIHGYCDVIARSFYDYCLHYDIEALVKHGYVYLDSYQLSDDFFNDEETEELKKLKLYDTEEKRLQYLKQKGLLKYAKKWDHWWNLYRERIIDLSKDQFTGNILRYQETDYIP